ncbi:type II secretion system protein GspM [Pseudoduganella flava]|nr:type II secretion system protein M [Pseudoduganella flava]QGZ43157.1 type II secretion system protein M [Pseudoduganella flava]
MKESVNNLRATAAAFWGARTEQERRYLAVGGIVVGLALFYALLIDPALTGRERLRKELPSLRQQAAEMQALANLSAQLAAQPPVQPQPLTREAVNSALSTRGLTAASLTVTGDYVKAEFKDVPFAGLVTWLDAVRRDSRLAVVEAKVTGQDKPGQVDASLTLRQEAGGR